MENQEAVSQTERTTSAKVLRQEGSQRGWNKIYKTNDKMPGTRGQNV